MEIVALCDEDLLGKVFEEGGTCLDLKAYRSFYEGRRVGEAEAAEMIRNAANLNLVGEKSLAAARKALDLDESAVRRVKGVPHLQVYRV